MKRIHIVPKDYHRGNVLTVTICSNKGRINYSKVSHEETTLYLYYDMSRYDSGEDRVWNKDYEHLAEPYDYLEIDYYEKRKTTSFNFKDKGHFFYDIEKWDDSISFKVKVVDLERKDEALI